VLKHEQTFGSVSVGSGRPKGRSRTRWCRSRQRPGSPGWRPTSSSSRVNRRRPDARRLRHLEQPETLYRPYVVRTGAPRSPARSATTCSRT
jgi:hypothetical protein